MSKKIWFLLSLALASILLISIQYDNRRVPSAEVNFVNYNQTVELWNYTIDPTKEFLTPFNYQDYITPDSPIVQKYAKELEIKDEEWNGLAYPNGSGIYIKYPDNNSVVTYWQNPDYTLTARYGDCKAMATVTASILEAKKIDSVIVMGYVYSSGVRSGHLWVEYYNYSTGTHYVNSNFQSFKRQLETGNEGYFYYSPSLTLISVSNTSDEIVVPSIKFEARYLFSKKLKIMPYNPNWISLI